ncbi:MAG: hypothetical protein AB7G25_18830, partial [Sphingomonadaceae bacterium]
MKRIATALLGATAALLIAGTTMSASEQSDTDWPVYGQNAGEKRYADLDQINTGNIQRLGLAWYHEF